MRTRIKQTHKIDTTGSSYHFAFGIGWVEDAITPLHILPQESVSSVMKDVKTKGNYHYNYCDHQQLRLTAGVTSTVAGALSPDYEYVDLFLSGGGLAKKHRVPCTHIIGEAKARHKHMFAGLFPPERVEKWFADSHLPTAINIDRDPFESGFSIWFLVADIILLPKLFAQILRRKIIRRPELFGTRTMKQLADDKLLVDFGILATFRDISEFVETLKRFREAIDFFEEMYDKTYRWHGQTVSCRENVPELLESREIVLDSFGFGALRVGRETTVEACDFNRTMAYSFFCPELRG